MYGKRCVRENLEVLCRMSLKRRKTNEETLKNRAVTFCLFLLIHLNTAAARLSFSVTYHSPVQMPLVVPCA